MMEHIVWIWLALLVIFIVTEVATVQLTCIWFAGGALVALILAAAGVDSLVIQICAFLSVSVILLIATRPFVKKFIIKKVESTNADRCIGKTGVVVEDIDNLKEKGAVKINGVEWSARSSENIIIPAGSSVTIEKIEGVKLIVK